MSCRALRSALLEFLCCTVVSCISSSTTVRYRIVVPMAAIRRSLESAEWANRTDPSRRCRLRDSVVFSSGTSSVRSSRCCSSPWPTEDSSISSSSGKLSASSWRSRTFWESRCRCWECPRDSASDSATWGSSGKAGTCLSLRDSRIAMTWAWIERRPPRRLYAASAAPDHWSSGPWIYRNRPCCGDSVARRCPSARVPPRYRCYHRSSSRCRYCTRRQPDPPADCYDYGAPDGAPAAASSPPLRWWSTLWTRLLFCSR